MLPLTLLNAAQSKPMLVELKNGETFNGHLMACDAFMNLTLKEVYQTSPDGEKFWKLPECYIRGSNIKYVRLAESVVDSVREQEEAARKQRQAQGHHHHHGGQNGGGRGGGAGGGRGGRGGYQGGGGRGGSRGGPGGSRGRGGPRQ